MKHLFKNKLFVLIALLALFVGMLGVAPVLAATTFVDESPALPDGMSSGTLYNVWGSSAGDVYAVGGGYIGNDGIPLLYHNAGSGWTPENLTLPDGLTAGGMFGVWGSGAEDIYAVGWGRDLNGNQGPLVYHKDSNNWTGTSLPLPNDWSWGGLYKVWGSSASDIYVVGFSSGPLAYHNDGNGWLPIRPANSGSLYDVWGSGANDVYVVGQGNDSLPRVYHNDGNGWTEASLPLPVGWTEGYLFRIWGSSANDVYAVGSGYDSDGNGHPLLYHNDGNGWTEATPALPDGWTYGSLRGIWGSSASDVYMVGFGAMGKSNDLPLLYHNDGNGWTEVALTVPDGWGSTYLQGVWGSSTGDVYFVGDGYPIFSATPLIYHTGASQTTAPTVSTDTIETLNARQVNATISDLGEPASVSAYGVVYNTTGNPDTDDSKVERNAVISVDDLPYSFNIGMDEMGLTAGAKYYVRAFATNDTGTSYGDELVVYGTPGAFTSIAPSNGATGVSTSPTLSWNSSAGATDYQYCAAAQITDCTSNMTGPNWHSTGGATTANLSGLVSNTNYIWAVRAVAGTPPSYKWVTGAPFNFTTIATSSSHTVTFHANGGSGSMANQTSSSAAVLTANAFTRTGYTFTGWNTAANGSGTDYANGVLYSFAADVTLYAQWNILTPSFGDVPSSHPYFADIEILYANGLTAGCSTTSLEFCPDDTLNRAQVTVFLLRSNYGGSYSPPPAPWTTFADDFTPGPWVQPWAQGMFDAGLTAGCSTSPRLFCPWEQMPRFQAAVFGLRLKYGTSYPPPAGTGTVFADITDPTLWYSGWAEQAYAEGLIPACGFSGGKPLFCPNDAVSRGLTAYMMVRGKNLTMP